MMVIHPESPLLIPCSTRSFSFAKPVNISRVPFDGGAVQRIWPDPCNGRDSYVEIPNIADYSASTTGELTIAAWIRPDTLNFPSVERNSAYIHWLGKGERSGAAGNQEWALRMYNHHDPLDSPPRSNRISFYLFNPAGGL